MAPSHWRNKTVAICGASAGLGKSLARVCVQKRCGAIALIARGADQLNALQSELQEELKKELAEDPSAETQLHIVQADVCEKASLHDALSRFPLQGFDLVINAVGQSDRGTIQDLDSNRLHELWNTNVVSALHVTQCFQAGLAIRQGTLVHVGSLASLFAPRYLGGYAIAKHGLAALVQQSRLELAESKVHVMLACPGPIARKDAGSRYAKQATDLPSEAQLPGGGAKVKGLDSMDLAKDILHAASRKRRLLIRPQKARLLHILSAIFPGIGESILRSQTS